eukprot:m.187250 g.187250  ORF g.187250 m.187250 type:complete len:904 (+) comp17518_c1_seq9:244-2955(+)
MESLRRAITGVKDLYNGINPATLSGAIDVIVIRQPDGSLKCSPFHVRFGKLYVLRPKEKVVHIRLNDAPVALKMKLGEGGECFFVNEADAAEVTDPRALCTSPIPTPDNSSSPKMVRKDLAQPRRERSSSSESSVDAELESAAADFPRISQTEPDELREWPWGALPVLDHEDGDATTAPKADEASVAAAASAAAAAAAGASAGGSKTPLVEDGRIQGSTKSVSATSLLDTRGIASQLSHAQSAQNSNTDAHRGSTSTLEQDSQRNSLHLGAENGGDGPDLTLKRVDSQASLVSKEDADAVSFHSLQDFPMSHSRSNSISAHGGLQRLGTAQAPRSVSPHIESALADETLSAEAAAALAAAAGGADSHTAASKTTNTLAANAAAQAGESALSGSQWHSAISESENRSAAAPSVRNSVDVAVGLNDSNISVLCLENMDVALSLCGGLHKEISPESLQPKFEQYRLTFADFNNNPLLISDPNLVVRINDRFYNWTVAAPIIMSMVVFGQPLELAAQEKLVNEQMPRKEKSWRWFGWRGRDDAVPDAAAAATAGTAAAAAAGAPASSSAAAGAPAVNVSAPGSTASLPINGTTALPIPGAAGSGGSSLSASTTGPQSPQATSPSDVAAKIGLGLETTDSDADVDVRLKKTLRLTSDQLKSLNLNEGENDIEFSVVTKLQGKAVVRCAIYLWNYDDSIVISDIDGTITRSDVLGHAAALIGRDWTHIGVANLYSNIARNGYKLCYLSSRSISHAGPTKGYLKGVKQTNTHTLPDGPVLLSPASFLASIHREVIARKPEEFKIACLQDFVSLFPPGTRPLVAGFGNRGTDELSYRTVHIPPNRIFTIDPTGLVRIASSALRTSYLELKDIVDFFFPPITRTLSMDTVNNFNEFHYWRHDLPKVDENELG